MHLLTPPASEPAFLTHDQGPIALGLILIILIMSMIMIIIIIIYIYNIERETII